MISTNEPNAPSKPVRTLGQDFRELGGMAKEMAQEKMEQVQAGAADYAKEGREKIQEVERTIEQYIRQRPVKSMLIAAGVGLVFGRFWMRR